MGHSLFSLAASKTYRSTNTEVEARHATNTVPAGDVGLLKRRRRSIVPSKARVETTVSIKEVTSTPRALLPINNSKGGNHGEDYCGEDSG